MAVKVGNIPFNCICWVVCGKNLMLDDTCQLFRKAQFLGL